MQRLRLTEQRTEADDKKGSGESMWEILDHPKLRQQRLDTQCRNDTWGLR